MIALNINGERREVDVPPDMPIDSSLLAKRASV